MNSLPEDLVTVVAPEPEPRTERHLRAVPPRRRPRPRIALWLGSIVSVASLFLLVAFNVMMVQGQFTLDRIANQRSIEQDKYEHLRDEVARWSSPDSIVSRAIAQGLVNSGTPTFLQAPLAAPSRRSDRTSTTQQQSWNDVKASLGASP